MKTLLISTSENRTFAALSTDGLVSGVIDLASRRTHLEALAPAVRLLVQHGDGDSIDLIGIDIGPGLFTSMRVGISTARALAFAHDAALVPISSLEALAVSASTGARKVMAIVDVRKGDVAFECFERSGDQLVSRRRHFGPVSEAIGLMTSEPELVLVGSGATRYEELLRGAIGTEFEVEQGRLDVAAIVELVERRFRTEGPFDNAAVVPAYGREPDAVPHR